MSDTHETGTKLKKVDADPGKAFFVEMLTRDLSLEDAILDLLDNCIDGALRAKERSKKNDTKDFSDFRADISITPTSFCIKDNCGGIPEDKLKYAFMHGRPKQANDRGIPTVGIYGIGMKRAIYKLGNEALVATKSGKLRCEVPFTKAWMQSDTWKLPIKNTKFKFTQDGTIVEVTSLRKEVKAAFGIGLASFVDELDKIISEHYAYLIERGFTVCINEKPVKGKPVSIQFDNSDSEKKIQPFFWQSEVDGVKVFVAVGFYRPPPKKGEDDEAEEEAENWRSEHSGWTVLCNHRVVAYCDKTYLTGWGERPIPRFHTQYNAIRGIVVFESTDAAKLPTTTTKRGLDVSSSLYAEVKNIMKEGVRIFIDSTNKWKGENEQSRNLLTNPDIVNLGLDDLRKAASKVMAKSRSASGGNIFKPSLPEPDRPDRLVWVRFAKEREEITAVAQYVLNRDDAAPSEVGEQCFDYFLKKSNKR